MSRRHHLAIALTATLVSVTILGCSTTGTEDGITLTALMKAEFADQPTEVERRLQQRCADHDIDACVEWGELLGDQPATGRHSSEAESDIEVPRSALEEPMETLRELCDDEVEEACVKLAFAVMMGFDERPDRQRAEELHAASCERGHLHSCTNLAYHRIADGEYSKAVELYRDACDEGEPSGCLGLAKLHEYGFGVDTDLGRALELYRQVCDREVVDGCTNAGRLLAANTDTKREGHRMLEESCVDGGDPGACTVLGLQLREHPEETDRAREMFQRACDGDDSYGCDHLGSHYAQRATSPRDFDRGIESFVRSCQMGSAYGCYSAATLTYHGRGSGQAAPPRAARLFAVGCGLGAVQRAAQTPTTYDHIMLAAANSCTYLGTMFHEGRGVSSSPPRTDEFLTKGCDRGSEKGCINLSTHLIRKGSPAELQRAETVLEQACDDEMGHACHVLGTALIDDVLPSSPDEERIRELFRRGCELEDPNSCDALRQY